jgi:hypothetical protein
MSVILIYIKKHLNPQEGLEMFTTTQLDNGILNNYAVEPEMYFANYPSTEQQERYVKQAAFASLLVAGLLLISLAVS